jgi:ABC-type phosphate transport system ATPase subunit
MMRITKRVCTRRRKCVRRSLSIESEILVSRELPLLLDLVRTEKKVETCFYQKSHSEKSAKIY